MLRSEKTIALFLIALILLVLLIWWRNEARENRRVDAIIDAPQRTIVDDDRAPERQKLTKEATRP